MTNRLLLNFVKRNLKCRISHVLVFSVVGVSTVFGCVWSMLTEHSVRFNSMRTGRGFYRLPPLPVEYDPATGKERSTKEVELGVDENNPELEAPASEDLIAPNNEPWETATEAIKNNDLGLATANFEKFLDESQYKLYWDDYDDRRSYKQSQRNAATDILDALAERKHGATTEAVVAYSKARLAFFESPTEGPSHLSVAPEIGTRSFAHNLVDNWAYLTAAILYNSGKKADALALFQQHDKDFPRSDKNEAAIYMIGKLLMEQGDACSDDACKAPAYESAIQQFKRILRQYPNGRYALDARGWLGHLYYHQNKTAESLAEYYRLLGNTKDRQWRLDAKKSLQILGHDYDDETLNSLEKLIADEPQTALTYAYHRIYNHAIDLSYTEYNEWCCYGENQWSEMNEENERVRKDLGKGRHELERVATFASAMVRRYGDSRVGGDFLLRVAQAQLELQDFREALAFGDKALTRGVTGDSLAQALWVKGSSEHQQKQFAAANATFKRFLANFPNHKLTEGVRRLLAMTAEDQNDLESALDIYFDLGYEQDIAYFVDVLMPTDRLAKYVADRRTKANADVLLYSLGIRYMRDGRWQEARDTLKSVVTGAGFDDYLDSTPGTTWYYAKEPGYGEPEVNFVKKSWVMQDLRTIDVIEYYEKRLQEAYGDGDGDKPEAMYQLASAYFELDDLAFYNPAMWDGGRIGSLGGLQFSSLERLPNETRTIFEHLQVHDPWAKAIPLYEEIVAKYSDTKVARDALYTIAVAHEKLEGRNSVWNEIYRRGLFAGPRKVTYTDVRNIYPDYQLPRGTYGWKPSTRTVNGGPGWAPKPKPLPKLTTDERVLRKLGKWTKEYGPWVGEKASGVKDSVRGTASSVSDALVGYLKTYYYLVYFGFIGAIFWQNRKGIYEGPVTKAALLAHSGLLFLVRCVRRWLDDVAIPSVVRVGGLMKDPREPPSDSGDA